MKALEILLQLLTDYRSQKMIDRIAYRQAMLDLDYAHAKRMLELAESNETKI